MASPTGKTFHLRVFLFFDMIQEPLTPAEYADGFDFFRTSRCDSASTRSALVQQSELVCMHACMVSTPACFDNKFWNCVQRGGEDAQGGGRARGVGRVFLWLQRFHGVRRHQLAPPQARACGQRAGGHCRCSGHDAALGGGLFNSAWVSAQHILDVLRTHVGACAARACDLRTVFIALCWWPM